MADGTRRIEVVHEGSRMLPRSFRWGGRVIRVRSIDSIQAVGPERRYRVRTGEGHFELGLLGDSMTWNLRKRPTWLGKMWDAFQHPPRYPLPFGTRRRQRPGQGVNAKRPSSSEEAGGVQVERFAVVR